MDAEPSAPASSPKHHDDEHCTDTSLMVKGAAVGVGFAAVIAALSFLVFYTLYGQHTVVTYQTIESHHYEDSWSGWGHKGHLDEAAAIFAVLGFLYYLKQIVATIKMVVTAICLIGWFVLTLCECHSSPAPSLHTAPAACTQRPPSPLLFPPSHRHVQLCAVLAHADCRGGLPGWWALWLPCGEQEEPRLDQQGVQPLVLLGL